MDRIKSDLKNAVLYAWALEIRSKNGKLEDLQDLAAQNRENLEPLAKCVKIDLEELKNEVLT
jgi:hypothetical protein